MKHFLTNVIKLALDPVLAFVMKSYSWHTFCLWQKANKVEFSPFVTERSVSFPHARLTLDASSALYTKSAKDLHVNVDNIIFPQIITHQEWSLDEVNAFLHNLSGDDIGLIDIGANIGLFTRQAMIASDKITHAYCFEPKISNFELASANLKSFPNVSLFNFGLSDADGTFDIKIDITNSGNISLNENAIRGQVFSTESIEVRRPDISKEPFASIAAKHSSLAYKSDTQGLDESIFTYLGTDLWESMQCAMLEIYRIPGKNADYEKMSEIFKNHFSRIYSINKRSVIEFSEYIAYSQGTDGAFDDILLLK